ncbi:hypothetical protein AUR64_00480 [Haloprofundus marisrubri]|uniref:Uncharacterized protein n=1 Tax=Haloprofundus marisrubri TaxID=1514971 RepID=A0A0W1R4P5_9EURY|nr:hypothetical protein [Haloprofundus marisrubri]KTG08088.1 hypothetical protein AUR64_00480 [Haloprofundus marisrubri]
MSTVTVHVGTRTYRGSGIDLSVEGLAPMAVYEAVVAETTGGAETVGETAGRVVVESPNPNTGYETLWRICEKSTNSLLHSLAAAARSRGRTAPEDDERVNVEATLGSLDVPTVEMTAVRRRVADAGADEARLGERVAELRGRLQARRETDESTEGVGDVRQELSETVARLTEVETERIAAEQALERAEREAADARDARERRLRLEDRAANLARAARRRLAEGVYDEFASALRSVPGEADAGAGPQAFRGDPVTARLAAVRVADLDAPVVLSVDRFDDADAAADALDTPVVRV